MTSSHALSLHAHPPPSPTRTLFTKYTARPLNPTRTLFQAALSLLHSTARPHPSNPTRTLFYANLSFNINFETKFTPP